MLEGRRLCGLDTIRIFAPVNSFKETGTDERNRIRGTGTRQLHGRCHLTSDNIGSVQFYPGQGYSAEASVPRLLGLGPYDLASAEDLVEAAAVIQHALCTNAPPWHLIPPPGLWSVTRSDLAYQWLVPSETDIVAHWISRFKKGTSYVKAGSHPSGKAVRKTFQLHLYDKVAERGQGSIEGRTILRLEAQIRRNGLIRKGFPYERTLNGIARVVKEGIPSLLSREIAQVDAAIEQVTVDPEFVQNLQSKCSTPAQCDLVKLMVMDAPQRGLGELLTMIHPDSLPEEVYRALQLEVQKRMRVSRPIHPLPSWST